MKEYARLIENLASNKESMVYANSGRDHAAIVFSAIFRYSKKEVCIYAGDMNGGISSKDEYLDSLKNFLTKGGVLKLMVSQFDKAKNPRLYAILSLFQFFFPNQVRMKVYGENNFKNNKTGKPMHFCTGDDDIYRIEYDTEKYAATGSFNDVETVRQLKEIYTKEFEKSSEIVLD